MRNDDIRAVFCKKCGCLIFSRSRHDFRRCDCGMQFIDGGNEEHGGRSSLNQDSLHLELSARKLLDQILEYDYALKNKNSHIYTEGYHGVYRITASSNMIYFNKLITNKKKEYMPFFEKFLNTGGNKYETK